MTGAKQHSSLTLIILTAVCIGLPGTALARSADSDIHTISTAFLLSDGSIKRRSGSGFVVGNRYYTALHNIEPASDVVEATIELGGSVVEPSRIDVDHDLAMFELEGELCARLCSSEDLRTPGFQPNMAITWFRNVGDERTWKRAEITNVAYLAPVTTGGCGDQLVVEVNQPFFPGSSGGPVFDLRSGAIVGLIQGSFESVDGDLTGFFKPIGCVEERLHGNPS